MNHDKYQVKRDPHFVAECEAIVSQHNADKISDREMFLALGRALHDVLCRFDEGQKA